MTSSVSCTPKKGFIDVNYCDTSWYECMNSDCATCHETIEKIFEVETPDLFKSYNQWKKKKKKPETACAKCFERVIVEDTISNELDNLRKQLNSYWTHWTKLYSKVFQLCKK